MQKIFVCKVGELQPEEIRKVDLESRPPISVCNVEGQYYALDDTCTHGQASLSEGEILDGEIECPFHGGTFCVKTGKAMRAPCIVDIQTYAVSVEEGGVYVVIG